MRRTERVWPEDVVVKPLVDSVEDEGGVVLLVPKFGSDILGRVVRRVIGQRIGRIKLDERGSHVWRNCDGQRSLREINQSLAEAYGDNIQDIRMRTQRFMSNLYRGGWISLHEPIGSTVTASDPSDAFET